jgi:tetratricopeptide (TPR) repeat protein
MKNTPSDKDKKRFQQAMQALNFGNPKEAVRLFDKVRKTGGNHPDIWYLMGLAYGKQGLMTEVKQVSMRALELDPNHFGALCNLANALLTFGDEEGALENYGKALKAKPGDPTVINNYGRALSVLGRLDEAIEHFKGILEKNQNYAPAHSSLGKAYAEGGYPEKALRKYKKALSLDPRLMDAHMGIGNLYAGLGGLPMAESHYEAAVNAEPMNIDARLGLGSIARFRGDFGKALTILGEAEKISPNTTSILAAKADLYERIADYESANKIVQRLRKEVRMNALAMSVNSHICRRFDTCDEAIELLEEALDAPQYNVMEKQMMGYDLGNLFDKLKRYDEAFEWYKKANDTINIHSKMEADLVHEKKLVSFFSKEAMSSMPRANIGSKRPIFILGMPRSGTSLTEQILAGHPDIYGAGELGDIKLVVKTMEKSLKSQSGDYLNALSGFTQADMNQYTQQYLDCLTEINSETLHVTDKMPHNFLHIGVISLLFPEAKIIHCRRNPLDNALSIYFQNFTWTHDYAVDLERIGKFYNLYDRLMKHWQNVVDIPIMTVKYEDMVEDKAAMSKKLIEFCGLDWDDSILDFHDSKRAIATASYDQVRQPIYKTSRERWKNYEKHLAPLMDALDVPY